MAALHGGRSNALRVGLRLLAAESERRASLAELLADWERDAGPVGDDAIAEMTDCYGLAT